MWSLLLLLCLPGTLGQSQVMSGATATTILARNNCSTIVALEPSGLNTVLAFRVLQAPLLRCTITFHGPQNNGDYRLLIQLLELDVNPGPFDCELGAVRLYSLSHGQPTLMRSVCGAENFTSAFLPDDNAAILTYSSDRLAAGTGFTVLVQVIGPPQNHNSQYQQIANNYLVPAQGPPPAENQTQYPQLPDTTTPSGFYGPPTTPATPASYYYNPTPPQNNTLLNGYYQLLMNYFPTAGKEYSPSYTPPPPIGDSYPSPNSFYQRPGKVEVRKPYYVTVTPVPVTSQPPVTASYYPRDVSTTPQKEYSITLPARRYYNVIPLPTIKDFYYQNSYQQVGNSYQSTTPSPSSYPSTISPKDYSSGTSPHYQTTPIPNYSHSSKDYSPTPYTYPAAAVKPPSNPYQTAKPYYLPPGNYQPPYPTTTEYQPYYKPDKDCNETQWVPGKLSLGNYWSQLIPQIHTAYNL